MSPSHWTPYKFIEPPAVWPLAWEIWGKEPTAIISVATCCQSPGRLLEAQWWVWTQFEYFFVYYNAAATADSKTTPWRDRSLTDKCLGHKKCLKWCQKFPLGNLDMMREIRDLKSNRLLSRHLLRSLLWHMTPREIEIPSAPLQAVGRNGTVHRSFPSSR